MVLLLDPAARHGRLVNDAFPMRLAIVAVAHHQVTRHPNLSHGYAHPRLLQPLLATLMKLYLVALLMVHEQESRLIARSVLAGGLAKQTHGAIKLTSVVKL